MLAKHIDVIAILAIVLGLLMFTKTPEIRLSPRFNSAEVRIQKVVSIVTRLFPESW